MIQCLVKVTPSVIDGFPNYTVDIWGTVSGPRGIRKPQLTEDGYHRVNLHRNGKQNHRLVHRLVAQQYLSNEDEEVNHIDYDRTNNTVWNLEWCDRGYNNKYSAKTWHVTSPSGESTIVKNLKEYARNTAGVSYDNLRKQQKGWKVMQRHTNDF